MRYLHHGKINTPICNHFRVHAMLGSSSVLYAGCIHSNGDVI